MEGQAHASLIVDHNQRVDISPENLELDPQSHPVGASRFSRFCMTLLNSYYFSGIREILLQAL